MMLLNGQETGEPGAGSEGFGGEDGRTTIYDYWTMPEFVKWVNNHLYDGAELSTYQKGLRRFYSDLLQLCQHASIWGDGYWGLWYFNRSERFADCPSGLYSFARFETNSGEALVVVANLRDGSSLNGQVRIPMELSAAVQFSEHVTTRLILNSEGATNSLIGRSTVGELASNGFPVSIPNQTSYVYQLQTSQL